MKTIHITYYKNRKLYSQDASRYVNLQDCKEILDAGYAIKFTAHKSGEDVTEHCLKELICKCDISSKVLLKLLQKEN